MDPVLETLLKAAEKNPLPEGHTSSHWRMFGGQIRVQREGDRILSVGSQVEAIYRPHWIWRVFQVLDRISYRPVISRYRSYPEVWGQAKRLVRDLRAGFTFNLFKSTVAASILEGHWREYGLSPQTVVIIGDSTGFLGALIRRLRPHTLLYSIDLPWMLVFQARTHQTADPQASLGLFSPNGHGESGVVFVHPDEIDRIGGPIDCAINIASMQEMKESSIATYFRFLRQRSGPHSRFYCVNRAWKELPEGEVTCFEKYPWSDKDQIFIDEPCPYCTHFFSPVTLKHGPRFLGVRIPFINSLDGILMHRLVHLSPKP